MKPDELVTYKIISGHSALKQFNRFENGRMITYGYRIDYDEHGKETARTEPEALSSIGWSDGSPFTKSDYWLLSR